MSELANVFFDGENATKKYVDDKISSIDLSIYAPKASPEFTGSISMGRAENTTIGSLSAAEGLNVEASGNYSHAEGGRNVARGDYSHAEGGDTEALGTASHAEGYNTSSSGMHSHAEGSSTSAKGTGSHSEGKSSTAQHAYYNETEFSGGYGFWKIYTGKYVEIVGNGTADSSRSNARTLDWNGNETLAGSLTLGSTTLTEAKLQQLLALLS